MNINWYSFEESYLLSMNVSIMECRIDIFIDARMSIEHPEVTPSSSLEEKFEEIKLVLRGVQYYRGINSKNLINDPNDDKGSIYEVSLKCDDLKYRELDYKKEQNTSRLTIDFNDGTNAEIFSDISDLKYLNFVSEMVAFRAGFESLEVVKE